MLPTQNKKLFTALLFCIFINSIALAQQPILVNGKVTNERGEPIQNVSVTVLGSATGTVTDAAGQFKISAPTNGKLIISSVGYEKLTIGVGSNLSIQLTLSSTALNDVVVIAYGSTQKKNLTGAVSVINSKDFQQGNIVSADQLIAGKAAGVSITSNGGSPGSGSVVRIRGVASLSASNDPLYVVDGFPLSGNNIYGTSNPLSLINPNDIASFSILKDAAAAAIYGSRASNGVILISTKRGSTSAPVINFNTNIAVGKLIKPATVLSTSEFRQLVDSFGTGSYNNQDTYISLMGTSNTNWQKEIYQTAVSNNNNLSIVGSMKDMPYRVSVGYSNQNGIVKTDKFERFSGNVALNPSFFHDQLKVEINLNGAIEKARFANAGPAISSANYFDPTQAVYDPASPYGGYFEWYATDPVTGTVTLNKLAPKNPVGLLNLYNNNSTVERSFGNIRLDYSMPFVPGLHANLNLGYDVAKGEGVTTVPPYAAQNYLDGGQNNPYKNTMQNGVGEFYLNYIKDIKSVNSNINVIGGYGYYNNLSTNYNYPFVNANGDTVQSSIPKKPYDEPQNTLISYYGRLIYTFNTKYILQGTIRYDGSSRFSPETRWGLFPSGAFTWRINQENFLKSSPTVSTLNLRLSYGLTGNQDGIYDYPYLGVYSVGDNASKTLFGSEYYNMATPAAYDRGIRWEQTATTNIGVDAGFFNNSLQASLDFYYKNTSNLLNTVPIPLGSNFANTILTNVGNMYNKGVELIISATPVNNQKFKWDVSFNIAYNENQITNLTATKDSSYAGTLNTNGVQINSVGFPANSFYVYHQQYNSDGQPIEGVYADVNHDGIINEKDLYHDHSPFPKVIMGFSTALTYKKWTVSTVLRANIGNYMYNVIETNAVESNLLNPLGYLANILTDIYNTHFTYKQALSDYYVQDASFLKMDNLGFSFNAGPVYHKVNLRVNANIQNVFTITKYTGQDPEIYGGIDNAFYPRPRTFILGVNLQF
jgi:TonB-linked SusC/RagA family outer membrane protein